jgi:hypothetical protein
VPTEADSIGMAGSRHHLGSLMRRTINSSYGDGGVRCADRKVWDQLYRGLADTPRLRDITARKEATDGTF